MICKRIPINVHLVGLSVLVGVGGRAAVAGGGTGAAGPPVIRGIHHDKMKLSVITA